MDGTKTAAELLASHERQGFTFGQGARVLDGATGAVGVVIDRAWRNITRPVDRAVAKAPGATLFPLPEAAEIELVAVQLEDRRVVVRAAHELSAMPAEKASVPDGGR